MHQGASNLPELYAKTKNVETTIYTRILRWKILIKEFKNEFNILLNVSREALIRKEIDARLIGLILKNMVVKTIRIMQHGKDTLIIYKFQLLLLKKMCWIN